MKDEIDLNKITAEVINQQLKNVTSSLSGEVKRVWQSNFASFKNYIKNSRKKYETTKTLLYKDRAVKLSSIYVGTKFTGPEKGREYVDQELFLKMFGGEKLIVSATAGAGKSFFAKYSYLALLASKQRIPVMLELRHLNESGFGIVEQVTHELRQSGVKATEEVVNEWLLRGKFALILDGFDELSKESIKRIRTELDDLRNPNVLSSVLITTRPSEDMEYFENLEVYRVMNLDLEQALNLIEKLDFDEKVKAPFLRHLKSGLFEKHRDFLSNPLLLTIMLMTYGDIAEIPSKMHVFYDQAFDVLFYRHDASKGMYRREIVSGLAIDDFRRILACVSASGYVRSKITYTNTELLDYIRKAKQTTGIRNLSPDKFKQDLLQSVCMLVNDGKSYTYNHRSFQEYFAAIFLITFPSDQKEALYEKYLERGTWESALLLAFEMNQNIIEKEFVIPFAERLKVESEKGDVAALKAMFSEFDLYWIGNAASGEPRYGVNETTPLFQFMFFSETAYRKIAGQNAPRLGRVLTKKSFIEELGCSGERTTIKLEGITADQLELIDRLGIVTHLRKRLKFQVWLRDYLATKEKRADFSQFESWL